MEWFRDLIICIYGILGVIALISIAIVSLLAYKKTKEVLDYIQLTIKNANTVVDTIKDEFVDPLVQIMAIVQGIKQGLNILSRFNKKEKGGKDGR